MMVEGNPVDEPTDAATPMVVIKPGPPKFSPPKLVDCSGGDPSVRELFVVEGDSAASAVAGLRSESQAVLPMQGKPLNAWKANANKVTGYPLFVALTDALGLAMVDAEQGQLSLSPPPSLEAMRYQRVLLLFDPDADGIHCGALMLMFLYRWLRPLLSSGRVEMVQAPLFHISYRKPGREDLLSCYASFPDQCQRMCKELRERGATDVHAQHHRGVGSMDAAVLSATCLEPATRTTRVVGVDEARAAIDVFCSGVGGAV
jgi:DNA gyrase subunit B